MVLVSRAADHSVLWITIAGLIAALGGRRARRAAIRGVLSVAVTSALVNGPLKLVWKRERPVIRRRTGPLIPLPTSFSFPSGHAASAFAFTVGAAGEMPGLLLPVGALAATVAYSRVHNGVHYPADVLAGAAIGATTAVVLRSAVPARQLDALTQGKLRAKPPGPVVSKEVVLVVNPHAGRAGRSLDRVRKMLRRAGLQVVEELTVKDVERLRELRRQANDGAAPVVVAAGGDGTVGAVANQLAESRLVMAVLPLGTSNDFARSLGIPVEISGAVELLTTGKVSTIDLGRVVMPGRPPSYFVHAATAGINVSFARIATRASLRKRLGRLTYVASAVMALRHHEPFDATLSFDGRSQSVRLTHLSVLNAPVFGGPLGLRLPGSNPDDRRLDVLALEDLPMRRVIRALTLTLFGVRPPIRGFHMLHVPKLAIHTNKELDIALDGEVAGKLPAEFVVAGEALRVITPDDFEDLD